MINRFNLNESEKNEIRKLHKDYSLIKEQDIEIMDVKAMVAKLEEQIIKKLKEQIKKKEKTPENIEALKKVWDELSKEIQDVFKEEGWPTPGSPHYSIP